MSRDFRRIEEEVAKDRQMASQREELRQRGERAERLLRQRSWELKEKPRPLRERSLNQKSEILFNMKVELKYN